MYVCMYVCKRMHENILQKEIIFYFAYRSEISDFYIIKWSCVLDKVCSAVERQILNQGSPGSNPHLLTFRSLGIFVLSMTPDLLSSFSCINEYLSLDTY